MTKCEHGKSDEKECGLCRHVYMHYAWYAWHEFNRTFKKVLKYT